MEAAGKIIGGKTGQILLRQRQSMSLEIGDLLVAKNQNDTMILQVNELNYGSQIQPSTLELVSGVALEQKLINAEILEPELRNYTLVQVRALAIIYKDSKEPKLPKVLPSFFEDVRLATKDDLAFLTKKEGSFLVGYIRSGSKVLDVPVYVDAHKVFSHHIFIPATTGRGKSNLVKSILWNILNDDKIGVLVLDAHNEYYGNSKENGLSKFPDAGDHLVYYTPYSPPTGANYLYINLQSLRPKHFFGIVNFTEAQSRVARQYWESFGKVWIKSILNETPVEGVNSLTLTLLKTKLQLVLGLDVGEDKSVISHNGVFDADSKGMTTIDDIVNHIEAGKVVLLDTSKMVDEAELLVGNIIAEKIFQRYREYKTKGLLERKPVVSIVIEEAPRVIGEDVLKNEQLSIYSRIAKEGRKFNIGLMAISQLTSVIPKTILANMNTKIILGNEMVSERQAIISSSAQDLSSDSQSIASLDKGEAIISSIFVPFALPIKIPLFDDLIARLPRDGSEYSSITVH